MWVTHWHSCISPQHIRQGTIPKSMILTRCALVVFAPDQRVASWWRWSENGGYSKTARNSADLGEWFTLSAWEWMACGWPMTRHHQEGQRWPEWPEWPNWPECFFQGPDFCEPKITSVSSRLRGCTSEDGDSECFRCSHDVDQDCSAS